MASPIQIGTYQAQSAPAYFNGVLWFQDMNNNLMAVPVNGSGAAGPAVNPNGLQTFAAPYPSVDGRVYFPGGGSNGSISVCDQAYPYSSSVLHSRMGYMRCSGTPVVPGDGFLYYTDSVKKMVWTMALTESLPTISLGMAASGQPVISPDGGFAYFMGQPSFPYLVRFDLATATFTTPGPMIIASPPSVGTDGAIYCQQRGNDLMQVVMTGPKTQNIGELATTCQSTPMTTEYGQDGYVYFQDTSNNLVQVLISDISQSTILDQTACVPCVPGNGYVYYMKSDNSIWQCATS